MEEIERQERLAGPTELTVWYRRSLLDRCGMRMKGLMFGKCALLSITANAVWAKTLFPTGHQFPICLHNDVVIDDIDMNLPGSWDDQENACVMSVRQEPKRNLTLIGVSIKNIC